MPKPTTFERYASKLRAEKVTDLDDSTVAEALAGCALRPRPEHYEDIRRAYYDQASEENALACPECLSGEDLRELSYRYTWQRVDGLDRASGGSDYGSFEYGDDVLVVGYSCGCGWESSTDLDQAQVTAFAEATAKALASMPTVREAAQWWRELPACTCSLDYLNMAGEHTSHCPARGTDV